MAYSGLYQPRNPKKYRGDIKNIKYRSSWELKLAIWCDMNPKVLKWNIEGVVVPYICDTDQKWHRYYVDFWVRVEEKDGTIAEKLIEVKPSKECKPPRKNKNMKVYARAYRTWLKNSSKWTYAKKYAEKRGMKFHILTEKQLIPQLGPSLKQKAVRRKVRKRKTV